MEVNWKQNLWIAWIGTFFTGASFSLVMPFMPIYIEKLGVPKDRVELYSGLAISISALASGLVAPIWGRLADQKGRKLMMIRASFVMTFTMGGLAFVPNVTWLLILRLLNGLFAGYIPNATALIASQTPKERSGYALGTLSTGLVGGTLLGPLLGGVLAQTFGIENVFIITGFMLLLVLLLTIFKVQEDFEPIKRSELQSTKAIFKQIKHKNILFSLFITSLIIQVAVQSIAPILTLYIRELSGNPANILFISGLIVSLVGVSAMISSPFLGRLGDKYGNHRLLVAGLVFCLLVFLPMAFVKTPFQLGFLRFLLGFGTGALMPSVNAILTKIVPESGISRIFSYNQMFTNFGQVMGPLVGSIVSGYFGYASVFIATSIILLFNVILIIINFGKRLKQREINS
ncbi:MULTISPECIES: multidrug efflux MFS transporter [unclassified Enterococcus]|uniref:multidrug efflux MFS transporter n=1 Tax=unclassified Enterococcus TaxID=2608891 RepID=UPI001557192A|nr:multidrug efflux MFS transporter [Enterococcus sp. MMGLQ5-2]MBS7584931.1 multidrug efflux MFS transporter [Enterococcus sp. MMGLQ5-1]NPD12786.1 multidrug efflux MFS transporter [Enterococcus sp. MMGLQ5-1]NPD37403.1 multidrug efflux MFS transporter [Enterococcus sp. MMGLQ5-2]